VLIRPALLAALPALLLAGWWIGRDRGLSRGRRALIAVLGVVPLTLVLTPWCVRNRLVFDRFALTIFTGRELWKATFDPWPGAELPIPVDGDGRRVRELIPDRDVDLRHNWSVSAALSQRGLRDDEVDRLMERVACQAVRRDPGRAAFCTLARCATFWYVWEWDTNLDAEADPGAFDGQHRIGATPWRATLLRLLSWTPERWPPAMWAWSAAAWIGAVLLLCNRSSRRAGVLFALIFAATTLLTAGLEVPVYRYRLVLEPLMIAACVAGFARYRGARRQRDDSSDDQG
jgi:hypothetical protein